MYYISEDFVVIADGVTSKSDFSYEGKSTGKIAAEIIVSSFDKILKNATSNEVISIINNDINDFYKQVKFPYSKSKMGLQAACVIYSNFYREIWIIGDCQVAVDGMVYLNPKKSDTILAEVRSLILHIFKMKDKYTVEEWEKALIKARAAIEPWIVEANVFANHPNDEYGYAVINGENIPENLIKTIQLDDSHHEITLTSDGYPEIKDNLKEAEEYLRTIIEKDPACYELYCSTKGIKGNQESFDDRTYIKFLI